MKVVVQYMVPVSVFVDTDTNEIERVLCEGSNITLNETDPVVDPAQNWATLFDETIIEQAIDITNSEDWPGWGYA